MDYSNYFDGVAEHVKSLYFSKGAAAVSLWIKNIGSKFLPFSLHQELVEYEDSELSGSSLCVEVIGKDEVTMRVGNGRYLLVWKVKKCS